MFITLSKFDISIGVFSYQIGGICIIKRILRKYKILIDYKMYIKN
jgi:hypothetical protein